MHFFSMYYNILSEKGFIHDKDVSLRIFNADETGCSTDPCKCKLFFKKSSKNSYFLTPTCGKAIYTVLTCGSAAGVQFTKVNIFMGLDMKMDLLMSHTVFHGEKFC